MSTDLETRVAVLESAVAELRSATAAAPRRPFEDMIGVFGDDPDFAEVLRFGREYRDSVRDPGEATP